MTKFYALLDTEEIQYIGDFDNIGNAMDVEPGNTHWVFSEISLRELQRTISIALGDD